MKEEILVIGRQEEILQTLLRLINKTEQWHATIVSSDEEAIRLFDAGHFPIVLLSSGIEKAEELRLRTHFKERDPSPLIIQHLGGGSGLLYSELMQATEERARIKGV